MSKELLGALDVLETEKGIDKQVVIDALEAALVSAYKRNYDQAQNVEVEFDQRKGDIHVYAVKKVVDQVYDSRLEVGLDEALTINKGYELGDDIKFEVTPKNFGRIAAQTAKQVILQRVREAERNIIYNQYSQYENEIVTGEVERQDSRFVYVSLGKVEAVMGRQDQMPNETYRIHDRVKVYVTRVENATKGPQVFVSRTHADLLKRLFEQEVPEIYDGTVEIMAIAREAGDRAKVAVRSNNPDIDPVGTSVGPRGQRVQTIVNELGGENMDIVEWTDDEAKFIANALNPAEVLDVIFDPNNERACEVIVPDYQLSLAIGKRGQNARLAAKLTGYKIDIKSESEASAIMEADQAADEATTGATVSEDDATEPAAETVADDTTSEETPVNDATTDVASDESAE
ncbi:transcription termination factor NusA [Levilactobacillus brevis]|jgi:N utilization substance protein A|uniref:Transcription termination/antitermination protein NusA n=5 Tax=Levilactobacillus brevis TaxID=1580 RepID=Q03QT2_LEVBA|nr:transcription termination factor NusA [Levilactobacillus brevis]MBL3536794.1 transcription termination/antitermination protein NusA [Lactobacillus sp. GPR40-2]MBL3630098.1 transcription termination/antitermination protein NusA [Lactobacillus sp. GPB7-4]ABJ64440.1 Transcription elongation factor [Levilactobacillus brevis ATCC 367]ARQ94093.1 transcription termination/antitermination protein NusA [Levilactobacillus brevis]ARW22271.1 Transcription termination/antitermination protein NusA [Levil